MFELVDLVESGKLGAVDAVLLAFQYGGGRIPEDEEILDLVEELEAGKLGVQDALVQAYGRGSSL